MRASKQLFFPVQCSLTIVPLDLSFCSYFFANISCVIIGINRRLRTTHGSLISYLLLSYCFSRVIKHQYKSVGACNDNHIDFMFEPARGSVLWSVASGYVSCVRAPIWPSTFCQHIQPCTESVRLFCLLGIRSGTRFLKTVQNVNVLKTYFYI